MLNKRNSVRKVIMLKAAFLMSIALLVSGFYGCSKTRDTSYTGDSNRVATASPNQDSGTRNNNNNNNMVDIINNMHDDMSKVDMTGDYDYDFSQMMIEHHRADVKLLDEEIDNGKDQSLVAMAKTTKDLKNHEIDQMKDWASNYKDVMDKNDKNMNNKKKYSDADYDRMRMNMMAPIDDMIKNMHSMNMTGNTDADFVAMAIHNGQAGIKMSNNEIKNGKNAKLKDMARTFIREDEKMGKDLQKWQDTRRTSKLGK